MARAIFSKKLKQTITHPLPMFSVLLLYFWSSKNICSPPDCMSNDTKNCSIWFRNVLMIDMCLVMGGSNLPDPDQNLVWFSELELEPGPGSIFEEPDPELDFWFHLWVELEPEVSHKSKERPPNTAKYKIPSYSTWSCLYSPLGFPNNQKFYTCISCQSATASRLMCWMWGWPAFEFPGQGTHGVMVFNTMWGPRCQLLLVGVGAWHRGMCKVWTF